MTEQNFPKYRQRLNLLMRRLSKEPAGSVSGIAYHVHDALRAGATRQEIVETIGVAMMMGGGPATMYGCHAFEALDQFETERAEEAAQKQTGQEGDC